MESSALIALKHLQYQREQLLKYTRQRSTMHRATHSTKTATFLKKDSASSSCCQKIRTPQNLNSAYTTLKTNCSGQRTSGSSRTLIQAKQRLAHLLVLLARISTLHTTKHIAYNCL